LGVCGAVQTQVPADPGITLALTSELQDFLVDGFGLLRHGGFLPEPGGSAVLPVDEIPTVCSTIPGAHR
jgi:hypothetical protein